MKTWAKVALIVVIPGSVVILAGALVYRWLVKWERGL